MNATWPLLVPPVVVLLVGALVLLGLEAAGTPIGSRKLGSRFHHALLTAVCAVLAALVLPPATGERDALFVVDEAARIASWVVLAMLALGALLLVPWLRRHDAERGELFASLSCTAAAWVVAAHAHDLFAFLPACALAVTASAPLLAVDRTSGRGAEAAMKLVLASAVALAVLAMGGALLFGAEGATDVAALARAASAGGALPRAAVVLVVVGIASVALVVPVHAPLVDVLEGGPPGAAALIVSGGATAAITVWLRFAAEVDASSWVMDVLRVLAAASLVVPALAALDQRTLGRAAAHLVIGEHAIAFAAAVLIAVRAVDGRGAWLALAAGPVAAVAMRAALAAFDRDGPLSWEAVSGVGRRHPGFALVLALAFASAIALPGTIGFAARAALLPGALATTDALLVGALAAGPVIATATVARLLLFSFARSPEPRTLVVALSGWRVAGLVVAGAALVAVGVAARPLIALALAVR